MNREQNNRKLVVSFHDLHPGSMECCIHFLEKLERLGISQASLLVVPYWYGREPIIDHSSFCAWLREQEHDICLHGWTHRDARSHHFLLERLIASRYTAGEGEFYRLPAHEAEYLVGRGLEMLHSVGIRTHGFVAPAWLMDKTHLPVLKRAGLEYAVTLNRFFDIWHNRVLRAPVLCTTVRTPLRLAITRPVVSLLAGVWTNVPLLRIAVHPVDFEYPQIEEFIYRMIAEQLESRQPATYHDLVFH